LACVFPDARHRRAVLVHAFVNAASDEGEYTLGAWIVDVSGMKRSRWDVVAAEAAPWGGWFGATIAKCGLLHASGAQFS
jgi:hypothetical protein